MKTHQKQSQPVSRTIQSKMEASKQASTKQLLQRYQDKTVQRQELEDEELLQGKFEETAQRMEEDELDEEELPVQEKSINKTGLPDDLKTGVENLSGYSMDDVRVHYNSSKPAQLQALAYTQGTDIHIAPGQEKHLPHEAWHVVQQKQGRVQPTMQLQGMNVNDDEGLEREADKAGEKSKKTISTETIPSLKIDKSDSYIYQLMPESTFQRNNKSWNIEKIRNFISDCESIGEGHAISKHIKIDTLGLIKRTDTGETRGDAASRFVNEEEQIYQMITDTLNSYDMQIVLEGKRGNYTFKKEFDNVLMEIYEENIKSGKGKWSQIYGRAEISVVINKQPTGIVAQPFEYYIKTAFPKEIKVTGGMKRYERKKIDKKIKTQEKTLSKGKIKNAKKAEKRLEKRREKILDGKK